MANIVAPKYHSLHEGEYLLFLNGQFDDNLNKLILIPNTPNQLFKAEKSSRLASWKSNNTEFENITEDDALPSINEADLLDAIDSLK
ncbi:hypothetical protein [Brevibacillus aydinogluensis]|uniref:hypothetical protein n=1 Tax=Brevibacillus aydinogluensis TaxID=927786 RepID=UPI0026F3B34E|nr:hypothetical protein [Brevibacillus aydinogluensis]